MEKQADVQWLLETAEPWTRYRTYVDLLGRPKDDADVVRAREEMVAHEQVLELIATAVSWLTFLVARIVQRIMPNR